MSHLTEGFIKHFDDRSMRWQPWDQIQGWYFRNGSIRDKVLVEPAKSKALYKDGKVYVASLDLAAKVDRGLVIRD